MDEWQVMKYTIWLRAVHKSTTLCEVLSLQGTHVW
jgi:hypothetical protein